MSNPSSKRPRLEPLSVGRSGDESDRQSLADTAMAGPPRRGSTPEPLDSRITPFPLNPREGQDSWFVRTGQILSRRTVFDSEDPPPVNKWAAGPVPMVIAAVSVVAAVALVAWLALST
ncbi:MAG: hypothetical protein ABMA64_09400 [Myxococcota bacterium]